MARARTRSSWHGFGLKACDAGEVAQVGKNLERGGKRSATPLQMLSIQRKPRRRSALPAHSK